MSVTLEQQADDDLKRAVRNADLLMGPIFKALGVKDAKALARKPLPCKSCGEPMADARFDRCTPCERELRGAFGGSDE